MANFLGLNTLLDEIDKTVSDKIDSKISSEIPEFKKLIKDAEKSIKENAPFKIEYDGKIHKVKGLRHKALDNLIVMASQKIPVMLVGMAGTGKTHAATQVAEALGLNHYTMSVGAQTSKSDIIGYMHASGGYVPTLFRKAYEEGGVFLMDEIDAGNANVLIQVNAALSNGFCAFPDKMVERHKDFVFIASANTFGNGANRMYVGRNQLDAATLDRFAVLVWDVDEKLEDKMAEAYGKTGKKWLKVVRELRKTIEEDGIRALVTPRATMKGCSLLNAGLDFDTVLNAVIVENLPNDKKSRFRDIAKEKWDGKSKKEKKRGLVFDESSFEMF